MLFQTNLNHVLLFVAHCLQCFFTSSTINTTSLFPVNVTECEPGKGCLTLETNFGYNIGINQRQNLSMIEGICFNKEECGRSEELCEAYKKELKL